uniref:Aspartate dehydrogenase n=1 Tax=Meloidogyne hapla TaxID=6305 RepID=A0A1I8BDH7_MELHA
MSCGMPPLHSRNEIIEEANNANFILIKSIDLMVISTENASEEEIFTNSSKNQQKQNYQKRIGIIGFGHLGQFLKIELSKSPEFALQKIWNRTEDPNEGVLPLSELNEENLKEIDLIIEVSHPDIIHNYANIILKHADLFIGSVTALAVEKTYNDIKAATQRQEGNRSVFIPSGALWGSRDIQKMADFGVLKTLSITTMLHPNALQLAELSVDSSSELKVLYSFCEECKRTNSPKVLYYGKFFKERLIV